MRNKRELAIGLLLAAVPVVITIIAAFTGRLEVLENRLTDQRHRFTNSDRKVSKQVMVVDIDDRALEVGAQHPDFGTWPWRRSTWVPLLQFISLGEPKLVLFDIMFFEKRDAGDELLAAKTQEFGLPVSHAINFGLVDEKGGDSKKKADQYDCSKIPDDIQEGDPMLLFCGMKEQFPRFAFKLDAQAGADLPEFGEVRFPVGNIGAGAPSLHSVRMKSDPATGITRYSRPLFHYEKHYYPSLALRSLHALEPIASMTQTRERLEIKTGKRTIKVPLEQGRARLHYYPAEEMKAMPRVSLSAVMVDAYAHIYEGKPVENLTVDPRKYFKDKVVYIGTSATALFDIKRTPYGDSPGVYLHATMLSNMLENRFLKRWPDLIGLLAILILVPAMALQVMLSQRLLIRVVIPLLIYAAYMGTGFALFKQDVIMPLAPFVLTFPASFLMILGFMTVTEGREKRKFKSAMGKYLSPDVLEDVMARGELTAEVGQRKKLSVMFTDIRSFTTLSENHPAEVVVEVLNQYLHRMVKIIFDAQGTLDKFIGDATMAFWGAPIAREDHALRAVRAGLKMQEEMEDLHRIWAAEGKPILQMGVGVNTGDMIVGNIGSEQRLDYTVIGDNVNLGSRMEGLTKGYGVGILISEPTYDLVKDDIPCRPMDFVAVKGKSIPIVIFEPLGDTPLMPNTDNRVVADDFVKAFAAYKERRWDDAIAIYSRYRKTNRGDDLYSNMMIERCTEFKNSPPAEDWNGVVKMTTK